MFLTGVVETCVIGPGVNGGFVPGAGLAGVGAAGVGVNPATPQSVLALIEIVAESRASDPEDFTNVQGIMFFTALRSDGTSAGTTCGPGHCAHLGNPRTQSSDER